MSDLYQTVTDKIISVLNEGAIPWIKPWSAHSTSGYQPFPVNAVSQRPYSGINLLLLWAEARMQGYTQDRWLTFNQARKAGGHVRKGEQSTLAVLYKPMERDALDENGIPILDENDEVKQVRFALLRNHFLFNIEQTEGLEHLLPEPDTQPESSFDANAKAEALMLQSGAQIRHKNGDDAFYSPIRDFIQLPTKEQFHDEGGYYATALHELTHWSGHQSRLGREGVVTPTRFGTPQYAFEELVAEMGAAFLCAHTGVQGELRHEGYLQSWLDLLREDKRAIFRASGQARTASEYLLALSSSQKAMTSNVA
ncbi:ArdC family protein [Pseudomonas sp. LRF_L74]|uniref:ArdC family protein n=1 Tax=Pseudomonas sp. LRF_L74 TaxID=3369422 RepID=UPI003F5E1237